MHFYWVTVYCMKYWLKDHSQPPCVFYFQEAAMNFIMDHPAVTQSDVYEELPAHLQSEISNLVTWNK